jgi:hypothetical protein
VKRLGVALALLGLLCFGRADANAQTGAIPLSYFGTSIRAASALSRWPAFPFGTARTWDGCYNSTSACVSFTNTTNVYWATIETNTSTCGTYSWTALDAIVAKYNAESVDIVYTFGEVAQCATGGTWQQTVPPYDLTSSGSTTFNNFVTALVTRYAGKIKYYELWNEPNLSGFWTGTNLQMYYMASGAYAAIKAADPTAIVLSPSSTTTTGVPWMQTFLAEGGGAYFDIMAFHCYPWVAPTEYFSVMASEYNYLQLGASLNVPIWCTEGDDGANAGAPSNPVNVAIQYILGWPSGLARYIWYLYDDASYGGLYGPLTGSNQGLNAGGAAYRVVASWLLNSTWTNAPARQAGANGVVNTAMTGASAGTLGCSPTGSLPTGWSLYLNCGQGITVSTSAIGTSSGGNKYIDIAASGTPTASSTIQIYYVSSQTTAALQNQWWTISTNVSLSGGSLANVATPILDAYVNNSGGSGLSLTTNYYTNIYPTSASIDVQNWQTPTYQLDNNASIAYIQPFFAFNYTSGSAINVTFRIALPDADKGTIWQGDLTRVNGAQSRIVWDASGGPTAYGTSTACGGGACGFARNIAGQQSPILSNSVTLTNSPIILDTAAQAVRFN